MRKSKKNKRKIKMFYLNLLLLPLLIIIIISIFGRYLSHKGIYKLIIIMMLELIIIALILNYEILIDKNIILLNLGINYSIINIKWFLYFDKITSIMILMILSISLLVIIFTYDYMINDPHINRFYLYIIIFIFNMILLITNNNLIILLIGWEGINLCLKWLY